jgi:hypothetical protein
MNRLLAFLVLSSPTWATPEILETPTYLISVDHHCPKGCVSCADGVNYIGKNKKTGQAIRLKGGTAHSHAADGTPGQFWGYTFKNGSAVYFVSQTGYIEVTDGEKPLVYEKGEWKE